MPWTYAELKVADAALGVADAAAAAAALNAQTDTLTNQVVRWVDAKRVARLAATGDWSRIVARARQTPALPPTTAIDAAILAAINAVESMEADLIDPSDTAGWSAWVGGISTLKAAGDLSQASVDAIMALTTHARPVWDPPVSDQDVLAARGL